MGVQALPTNVFGLLPRGTLGLIIGRSSTILRGIQIHPGVVDADYQGEIKIMTSVTQGVTVIPQGDRIAQLDLALLDNTSNPVARSSWGAKGFGSSGTAAFWVAHMKERPQLELIIDGKSFNGILDSGADVSVLSLEFWPKKWPLESSTATLQGIGQASPKKSAKILKWQDNESHEGYFQPYVLPGLPVNLWGRDVLSEMGAVLTTQPTPPPPASQIMQQLGWRPGQGLGKNLQGQLQPVTPDKQITRLLGD